MKAVGKFLGIIVTLITIHKECPALTTALLSGGQTPGLPAPVATSPTVVTPRAVVETPQPAPTTMAAAPRLESPSPDPPATPTPTQHADSLPTPSPSPEPVPLVPVLLRGGSKINVRLVDPLTSYSSRPEDGFRAVLAKDLRVGSNTISAGALVKGVVIESRSPTYQGGKATLALKLSGFVQGGRPVADVRTDILQIQRGSGKVWKVLGGIVVGVTTGYFVAGRKGGMVGGAGGGAGGLVASRGGPPEVELGPGSELTFKTREPQTIYLSPSLVRSR